MSNKISFHELSKYERALLMHGGWRLGHFLRQPNHHIADKLVRRGLLVQTEKQRPNGVLREYSVPKPVAAAWREHLLRDLRGTLT